MVEAHEATRGFQNTGASLLVQGDGLIVAARGQRRHRHRRACVDGRLESWETRHATVFVQRAGIGAAVRACLLFRIVLPPHRPCVTGRRNIHIVTLPQPTESAGAWNIKLFGWSNLLCVLLCGQRVSTQCDRGVRAYDGRPARWPRGPVPESPAGVRHRCGVGVHQPHAICSPRGRAT